MPKPYGEDSSTSQLSHWIDRAVQAEFRAEKFEAALSKEVLAVIQKAAQVASDSKEIERLKDCSRDVARQADAEIRSLKAEVVRLTKAGNGLENCIRSIDPDWEACRRVLKLTPREIEAVDAWKKAKEGGQS